MTSSASHKDLTPEQTKSSSHALITSGESTTKENIPSTSEDTEKKECPFKSLHILPRESYIRFILRLERLYRSRRVPFRYTPCDYFYPPDMLEKAMETTRNLAQQQRDHPPDIHDEPDDDEDESEEEESEEEDSEDEIIESPPPSPDNSRTKICPFDPEHVVPKEFYLRHLVYCRRHFGQFRISCPYRPWEFFYPQEMLKHMTRCPGAPRSRTYEEHRAVFENHYRREEFYPKDQLENTSGDSEEDEDDNDGPIRCPYNPEELIYRDMIEDHILRCDFADEWYRKNPINTDDESDSD